jgi:transcriptional regulator with XRE-family HTH domain
MIEINSVFAENLRRYRREKGFTQLALADHAGLSESYVGRLERAGSSPRLQTIGALAVALGVKPMLLLMMPDGMK